MYCGIASACRSEQVMGAQPSISHRPMPGSTAAATASQPAVSALGSDVSALPRLYPHGDWLPIEAPVLSMQVLARVKVNGRNAVAVIDTGAMGTTMSLPMATRLGIVDTNTPRGTRIRAIDAHGDVIFGEKLTLGELTIGRHIFKGVNVTVLGNAPELFLVGADVLEQVDLFIAADEGLLGIFDPGQAPRLAGEIVVKLDAKDRQLFLPAAANGYKDTERTRFDLLLDTGAWNTSVPASIGINGGVAADLSYSTTTVGVAGEQEVRGRFVMDPLFVGSSDVSVGKVLAVASTIENGNGFGLLGNDVLMRFHTIVSFRNAELRLRALQPRPSERSRGPAGVPCTSAGIPSPCVKIALIPLSGEVAADDMPGVCLQIDIDAVYSGQTVELAITAENSSALSLFNGGAIRAFLSVDHTGSHHCFSIWRQLDKLGVSLSTPLSLRWVRTEGVIWPCDPMKTRCITFTGSLSQLDTK